MLCANTAFFWKDSKEDTTDGSMSFWRFRAEKDKESDELPSMCCCCCSRSFRNLKNVVFPSSNINEKNNTATPILIEDFQEEMHSKLDENPPKSPQLFLKIPDSPQKSPPHSAHSIESFKSSPPHHDGDDRSLDHEEFAENTEEIEEDKTYPIEPEILSQTSSLEIAEPAEFEVLVPKSSEPSEDIGISNTSIRINQNMFLIEDMVDGASMKSEELVTTCASPLPIIDRKAISSAPQLINSNLEISLPGSVSSEEPSPAPPEDLPQRIQTPKNVSVELSDGKSFRESKELLTKSLAQMDNPNWEEIIEGLKHITTIARNHPELIEQRMHPICVILSRNINNLRSQVSRSACQVSGELFQTINRKCGLLDKELEELASSLLNRTADTNKFLRRDANSALDSMCINLSTSKIVAVIYSKGSNHRNGVVRTTSLRLLNDVASRIGYQKVYEFPKETRDKFFLLGANGLIEGSLEARKYAKTLMGNLAKHHQFQKILTEAIPLQTVRHISKIISNL